MTRRSRRRCAGCDGPLLWPQSLDTGNGNHPPQRIQLRRTKGWRKPLGAITVARPTIYGTPFPANGDPATAVVCYREWLTDNLAKELANPSEWTPRPRRADIEALPGLDLACWCPLDQPCHADVLLEWANR
jgi:hypothetical protein